ncbi:MAG: secreted protein [Actinomycetia bacterium]|nr:secreted protein [Actinomycetes bacterium]
MRRWLRTAWLAGGGCVLASGMLLTAGSPSLAATAGGTAPARTTATPDGQPLCIAPSRPALAARMSAQIAAALRGRSSTAGLAVSDPAAGLSCAFQASRHFDSASVVKATILAALLRARGGDLTDDEQDEATLMITESDNDAASDLWNDVGTTALERFLGLAGMTQTVPGADGYWGLTQVTARDQLRLLHLLTTPNGVLSRAERSQELGLMATVDPAQRWGISAGVPSGMTVEIKNGWLPRATLGWRINSIGCVTGKTPSGERQPGYCLAVLTDDNPTMAYGVQTVSGIARVVNQDLNSRLALQAPAGLAGRTTPAGTTPASAAPASAAPAGQGSEPGKGGGIGSGPDAQSTPRSLLPRASVLRPSLRDWLGGVLIAAVLALFVIVAHLRRRPGTVD